MGSGGRSSLLWILADFRLRIADVQTLTFVQVPLVLPTPAVHVLMCLFAEHSLSTHGARWLEHRHERELVLAREGPAEEGAAGLPQEGPPSACAGPSCTQSPLPGKLFLDPVS